MKHIKVAEIEPIVIKRVTEVGKSAKNAGTPNPKMVKPNFPKSISIPEILNAKGIANKPVPSPNTVANPAITIGKNNINKPTIIQIFRIIFIKELDELLLLLLEYFLLESSL